MKYTILSKVIRDDTIVTEVEYVYDDGTTTTVSVTHFRPQSLADVILGITNRGASEEAKLLASKTCKTVLAEITTGKQVTTIAPK